MSSFDHASFLIGVSLAGGTLAWAAVSDFTRFLIPNRVCLLLAAAYVLAAPALPLGQWLAGLALGVLAFALGFVLFARGWLGGGDVKLAAAVSLWAGPAYLTDFTTATSLTGVSLALLMLSPARRWMPQPTWGGAACGGLGQPMPFGVPLAAGGLWVLARHLLAIA